jgi:peroxiredoxin
MNNERVALGRNGRRNALDPEDSSKLAVGDPAPDFHLPASAGREIALSDYRGKHHVVLFFVRAYQ